MTSNDLTVTDSNTIFNGTGIVKEKVFTFQVFMILFYVVAEYARPGFIAPIRPALLAQVILALSLFANKGKTLLVLRDKFFKLYIALMLLMVVHVFIAVNNYWALMQLEVMFSYLIIAVSCCVFIDSTRKLNLLILFFIIIAALCALNRMAGAGFLGVTGPMGDTNDFALAMNVFLPLSFFLARCEYGWKKWFLWLSSLLFVLANISCASRGGFLGLAAVGLVCFYNSQQKFKALLALSVLAVIAWNFASPSFKKEILAIGAESAEEDTGKDRIELWKVSWRAFKDNPAIGVGQGNMPIVFGRYQKDKSGKSFWSRDYFGRAVHSVYFTMLPELGAVGTLIIALMLKDLIEKFKKIKSTCLDLKPSGENRCTDYQNIALLVSIIGFLTSGVFLSALYYPELWNISGLVVALFFITSKKADSLQLGIASNGELQHSPNQGIQGC